MSTWEFTLVFVNPSGQYENVESYSCSSLGVGLVNGGFGGLFWMFVVTSTFYATIVASLAEMESM